MKIQMMTTTAKFKKEILFLLLDAAANLLDAAAVTRWFEWFECPFNVKYNFTIICRLVVDFCRFVEMIAD